jgi:hypothetical protein
LGKLNHSAATRIGIIMHEALAVSMRISARVILFARNLKFSAASKILNGIGFGYILFFAVTMKNLLEEEV